ncbi:MAG TPA: hypothetical protein DCS93_43365 [Microscillaceae bacterium]|nr:hypothetical protein [Microscillaceae bacterium]
MKKILPILLIVVIAFCGQACKKKEESDPAPQPTVLQLGQKQMDSDKLMDLTDGTNYTITDALNNTAKIDINYSKSLTVNDGTKDTLVTSVLVSADAIGVDGNTPFNNLTTLAPLSRGTLPVNVTDPAELKTLYDQAVTDFGGESRILFGIPANVIIMFKIRGNGSNPKYGGIQFDSFNADSTSANVTITVQE